MLLNKSDIQGFNLGLLISRGKKVKFRGIFSDKFAEKSADFAGIWPEFSSRTSLKSNR